MAYPFCGLWPRWSVVTPTRIRHLANSRQSTTFDYISRSRVVHHSLIVEFGSDITSYRAEEATKRNREKGHTDEVTGG
jgi:hypothetical protein